MRLSDFPVRRTAGVLAACSAFLIAGPSAAQPTQEARLRAIEARLSALEARVGAPSAAEPAAAPAAAGASVGGDYGTDYGSMTLVQSGADVQGNYDLGRIAGRVEGDVLKGYWLKQGDSCPREVMGTRNYGRLEFRFDATRQSFLGYYGYCDGLPTNAWNGRRR
jgi:hypothetical protein